MAVKIGPVEGPKNPPNSPKGRAQGVECLVKIRVVFVETLNFLDRVHHRRMVLVVEQSSDLRKRETGEVSAEVHRNLAREGDSLRVGLGLQVGDAQTVVRCDG